MPLPTTKAICNGWVKCKYKVLSSLLRLVTVDKYVFKNQPLQIAKRCVPFTGRFNEQKRQDKVDVNKNQEQILNILSKLSDGQYYKIEPATSDKIEIFKKKATERKVDKEVIDQLVELYEIADNFYYEIVIGFHSCIDDMIFEWWSEKELWLGQRDFNTLRWTNGKFCLGDASTISYSDDYKADNLVGLLECCMREIENANNYDKFEK